MKNAKRAGLEKWHLQSRAYRRLGRAVYAASALPDGHELTLSAALARLPSGAVFVARTAPWLNGLAEVEPCNPIEVNVPKACGASARAGMSLSRARIDDGDIQCWRGLPATTLRRTLLDVGQRLSLVEAVVIADLALHSGLITLDELTEAVRSQGRTRNVVQVRRMVELAEPGAESQMESRLRVLLVSSGLPRPQVQVSLYDEHGEFLGRPDLYYPAQRLIIEYDGSTHRHSLTQDARRQNRLVKAGYTILRFTAADVLYAPQTVVVQVRAALLRSGHR